MNRIRFAPKILALTFMSLLSFSAYAYRPTYTYSATVQACLSSSSTGGGLVYVDAEATGYITVSNDKWRPNASENGSEGGNSSNTQNAMVDVYLYAKANRGYQFDGWAASDTGTPGNKGELVNGVYRSVQEFQVGNNDFGPNYTHPYRNKEHKIYAFFSPIKYYITYDANGGSVSPSTPQEYTIRSTDALRIPTRNGYTFAGWEVVDYDPDDGNWDDGIAESPLDHKFGNVGLQAQWTLNDYTISYAAGDHSTGGSTSATTYDIENGFSLASNGFTPATGWVFDKWKVTTAGSGPDGNWTLNSTYDEGESFTAGKFGNVTMTALWKTAAADITITVSGLQGDDSAIFTVSSGGSVLYTVSVSASKPSVTIKNLPIDVTYDVNPKHQWNWNYSGTNVTESFSLGASGHTASFTYTKNTSAKKHDEKSNVNWRP